MDEREKTREQLVEEINILRGRLAEAESLSLEYKNIEKRLKRNEEYLRLFISATNDLVWDCELPTGWDRQEVLKRTLFGYGGSEMGFEDNWWIKNIHPEDKQRVESGIHKVFERGEQFWSDEYRFCFKGDSYAFVSDRGFVIYNEKGQAARMFGSMQDITDRKKAEEMFRGRGASASLEKFIGGCEMRVLVIKEEIERLLEELRRGKEK